mmetsp:Transcript_15168/g.51217  ORF Transcript_15168/g.51217 Transcript_15168/m.51217 type:complete len:254 (+) Transcript_15168:88-849(+)
MAATRITARRRARRLARAQAGTGWAPPSGERGGDLAGHLFGAPLALLGQRRAPAALALSLGEELVELHRLCVHGAREKHLPRPRPLGPQHRERRARDAEHAARGEHHGSVGVDSPQEGLRGAEHGGRLLEGALVAPACVAPLAPPEHEVPLDHEGHFVDPSRPWAEEHRARRHSLLQAQLLKGALERGDVELRGPVGLQGVDGRRGGDAPALGRAGYVPRRRQVAQRASAQRVRPGPARGCGPGPGPSPGILR